MAREKLLKNRFRAAITIIIIIWEFTLGIGGKKGYTLFFPLIGHSFIVRIHFFTNNKTKKEKDNRMNPKKSYQCDCNVCIC